MSLAGTHVEHVSYMTEADEQRLKRAELLLQEVVDAHALDMPQPTVYVFQTALSEISIGRKRMRGGW